jgi:hypothetical protein
LIDMAKKAFLISDKGEPLRPMVEQAYESEDMLQGLLAQYPDLLAGDEMDPDNPRRWLLVTREMGVPDAADSAGRWSLDHLFLDQDGILTLVEVKRATDTRARREVVAQMLDYAANAVLYWPHEQIVAAFERTARAAGREPAEVLAEFLAPEAVDESMDVAGQFWTRVKTNLAAEHIRMVFVADQIPRELQRIVEFLNDQMDPAKVIAVEVQQFVGEGIRTLVPRTVGQTVRSTPKGTGQSEGREWDHNSFMEEAKAAGGEAAKVNALLIDWFTRNAAGVRWGNGVGATFTARMLIDGDDTEVLRVFAEGSMQVSFGRIEDDAIREELRSRLSKIDGFSIAASKSYPRAPLAPLATPEVWQQFSAIYGWLRDALT